LENIIFDLIHAVNRMKDKIVDLPIKVEKLGNSPSFMLSRHYLSEEEACRLLKCCPRVLADMRANNEIPYYRIKRRILYKASDLHEYVEKHYVH
jgi:excisionase family DNA binding protein